MTGAYVDLLGHPTWVEDTGGDRPALLLLHGGFGGSGNWKRMVPHLAQARRIVMFDRRGHGRTADTAEPFHYESMADETIALIEHLGLAPVDAVGWSDGGNLLLCLARRRPDLLASMVLISANYHHDALLPEAIEFMRGFLASDSAAATHARHSPDGADHWAVVAGKGFRMGALEEPTFTAADLAAIRTPTLVMAGDDDMFPLAHTVSMFEALPDAQLAIVPGTSHLLGWERPEEVAALVLRFVEAPRRPATAAPMRRGG